MQQFLVGRTGSISGTEIAETEEVLDGWTRSVFAGSCTSSCSERKCTFLLPVCCSDAHMPPSLVVHVHSTDFVRLKKGINSMWQHAV